jgi:hypothetical protein
MRNLYEQIAQRCVHFQSPIHMEECKAKINYRELAGEPREGCLARLPCVRTALSKDVKKCKHLRLPDESEVMEEIDQINRMYRDAGISVRELYKLYDRSHMND